MPAVTGTEWQDLAGAAPPRVLHSRPVEDAEEVLVLTYTCDLAFVEDVCVQQARAAGARVTVVYDADRVIGEAGLAGLPARDYVPVPVVCRDGGAFHPKLVVIASSTDAVVSIGSGNATAAGWHHNAEVWTHLRADGPTVPAVIGDLAGWLRRLPGLLWIDRLGAERLHAVADLLTARPVRPEAGEPLLLTNDESAIVEQLPFPDRADRLVVASPFFDPRALALTELIRQTKAEQVGLVVTRDVQCDTDAIERALERAGSSTVATPAGSRYHHGKVVEWWAGEAGAVVTGSANCTHAALLRTMADGGNCELALLQEIDAPVLDLLDVKEIDLATFPVRGGDADSRPAPVPLRVLAVRWSRSRVEVVLLAAGAPPAQVVVTLAGRPHTVPLAGSDGAVHTYAIDADLGQPGRTATVQTADGSFVADALVTDVDHALTRITRPSPLEETTLAGLLGDEQRMRALFDALDELAAVLPAAPGGSGASGASGRAGRTREEARLAGVVGPALLHLALGRDTSPPPQPADDDVVTIDEAGEDEPRAASATTAGALDRLDRRQREQLQRRFAKLLERSAGWPVPAQLAAYRIVLLVAAGGLWPHPREWAPVLGAGLAGLWSAPAEAAFAAEHAALASVGFVAFRNGQLSCPDDPELAERVAAFRSNPNWVRDAPAALIDRYCADLSGTVFGHFTGRGVRDDLEWLLQRDPLDEALDALASSVDAVERQPDGAVKVRTKKEPRRIALLVLDALRDHPGTHVVVVGATGAQIHGWWDPPRLRLVSPAPGGWEASTWTNLMTGIASYTRGMALPRPATRERLTSIEPE